MRETLGFVRLATSESLLGAGTLALLPLGVLGYYIYKSQGTKPFTEWIVGSLITVATLIAICLVLFIINFIKAPFRLQQEADQSIAELAERVRAAQITAGDDSGRDEFIVLAGRLRQFLTARSADYDSQQFDDMLQVVADDYLDAMDAAIHSSAPGKRARQRAAMKRSHNDSTLREYGERFAKPVVSASRRLRELRFNDAADRLGEYPKTVADLEAIAGELETASAALAENKRADTPGLSAIQVTAVREVLKKYPRPTDYCEHDQYRYFIIFPVPGVPESSTLAAQLRAVFRECGFDPQLVSNELPGLRDTSRFARGIWLRGTGDMEQGRYDPPTLTVVRETLERAAIRFQYAADDVGDVELIIGAPPETPNDSVVAELSTAAYHHDLKVLRDEISVLHGRSDQRRLSDDQQNAIAGIVRKGLDDLRESIRSSPTWTPDFAESSIFVELYIVESERETSVYRDDFERAFKAAGLGVMLGEIVGTLGERGNEQFVGVVSVLRESPENAIRSFVLKALQSAGIAANECDDLPNGLGRYRHDSRGQALGVLGATLIIGQRG